MSEKPKFKVGDKVYYYCSDWEDIESFVIYKGIITKIIFDDEVTKKYSYEIDTWDDEEVSQCVIMGKEEALKRFKIYLTKEKD